MNGRRNKFPPFFIQMVLFELLQVKTKKALIPTKEKSYMGFSRGSFLACYISLVTGALKSLF